MRSAFEWKAAVDGDHRLGVAHSGAPFDSDEIACAVDDAHDLCAFFTDAVKNEPSIDDERTRILVYLWTRAAESGMILQPFARLLDVIVDAIGNRLRVPRGDVNPDVE